MISLLRCSSVALLAVTLAACSELKTVDLETVEVQTLETVGSIDMKVEGIIAEDAVVENLGGEFGWSEGPVWIAEQDRLLFTDVPGNMIWSYKDGEGLSEYLKPSGHADPVPEHIGSAGANGLIRWSETEILLPDHGNRALYTMSLETKEKTLLVDSYDGKKLSSPNDAVLHKSGILFFTDPPYGLKGQDESEMKEQVFNGVYALYPDGRMSVVESTLTRPNGIILSPDETTLYVANSDSNRNIWMAYPVTDAGDVGEGRLFLNATSDLAVGEQGLADGMAIDVEGRIYATGPGGVLVISPNGERLGLIRTGSRVANVTFGGADNNILYMTSASFLARVPTLTQGHIANINE